MILDLQVVDKWSDFPVKFSLPTSVDWYKRFTHGYQMTERREPRHCDIGGKAHAQNECTVFISTSLKFCS